jgi:hypothetical protein
MGELSAANRKSPLEASRSLANVVEECVLAGLKFL